MKGRAALRYIVGTCVLLVCSVSWTQVLTLEFHRHDLALSTSFLKQLNHVFKPEFFLETGTCQGNSTVRAAHVFPRVYTVELSRELFAYTFPWLGACSNITAVQGNSVDFLRQLLPTCKEQRGMIFLDAHYSGGVTAKGEENTPLEEELKVIKDYAPNAVLLIDDLRLFQERSLVEHYVADHPEDDNIIGFVTVNQLKELLLEINPDYELVVWGDIGVVYPKNIYPDIELSPVLTAMTQSRLVEHQIDGSRLRDIERAIIQAQGTEKEAVRKLLDPAEGVCGPRPLTTHYRLWAALTYLSDGDYKEACTLFGQALEDGLPAWRVGAYLTAI